MPSYFLLFKCEARSADMFNCFLSVTTQNKQQQMASWAKGESATKK